MIPDPTLQWRPFPSVLDGIGRPPFALDVGLYEGVLHLIILEPPPRRRAFGVTVPCQSYQAVEEMIYSVAYPGHNASYDGTTYLKEAVTSASIRAFQAGDPLGRSVRQFLLVGSDFCYETLGFDEPVVREFDDLAAAYDWHPWKDLILRSR